MIDFIKCFFILIILGSCNLTKGSKNLGNNLYLLEGDNIKDRIIVFCNDKDLIDCNSGSYVLPKYDDHMVNGVYEEYVEEAKSNESYVLVKTYKLSVKESRYWIIDVKNDFEVLGAWDYEGFKEHKNMKGIYLSF